MQKEKELLQAEMERHREERENEQRMNRLQMQQLEEKQAEVQVGISFFKLEFVSICFSNTEKYRRDTEHDV